jgi:dehydrogenase/reductase SDR family member 1
VQRRLDGKVALVTGASRGIGKGVALGLGEAGATVYLTARTGRQLDAAAREVSRYGGKAVATACDHRDDGQVRALFRRIEAEHGQLDLLVNNLFPVGGDARAPFWELPPAAWDDHAATLRAQYMASRFAAPMMIGRRQGLIVFISSTGAATYFFNVPYHAVKAAVDKMASDMAHELRPHDVAVLSLWPRLTKTETVLARPDLAERVSGAATPQFVGRAVAALAGDPDVGAKSGRAIPVLDVARDYGFTDVDGTLPDW